MGATDWLGPSRQTCPCCGRGARDRTLSVTLDEHRGVAYCHRCAFVEWQSDRALCRRSGRATRLTARGVRHESLSDYGRALWRSCKPVSGAGRAYLEARCCVVPPSDGDLRFHPALRHPQSGVTGPALVGLVSDAVTRAPMSLHRTWICGDGRKAPVDPPRLLLGGHRKAGGVVRLWPDEAVSLGLGVGEGIETALSLAHAGQPVWALVDAANLAAFPVLPGIESLLIAADHDDAGRAAANTCGLRWEDAGKEVGIMMSEVYRADLNDVARAA